eukprot:7058735-Alexandrium_andersonii.AAC.1
MEGRSHKWPACDSKRAAFSATHAQSEHSYLHARDTDITRARPHLMHTSMLKDCVVATTIACRGCCCVGAKCSFGRRNHEQWPGQGLSLIHISEPTRLALI